MIQPTQKLFIVFLGAVFALLFAFYWQYVKGLHPCELCMLQRWFYAGVILAAVISFRFRKFRFAVALILAGEVAVAIYHTGIEQHWWQGFQNCSTTVIEGQSLDEIRAKLMGTPLVRCDEPVWHFVGLSMAAWNAIFAAILLLFFLWPKRAAAGDNGS